MVYLRKVFDDIRDSFVGKTTPVVVTGDSSSNEILNYLKERINKMAAQIDTLQNEVERAIAGQGAAIKTMATFIEEIKSISEQLKLKTDEASGAASDLARINDLAENLKASNDSLLNPLNSTNKQ